MVDQDFLEVIKFFDAIGKNCSALEIVDMMCEKKEVMEWLVKNQDQLEVMMKIMYLNCLCNVKKC